MRNLFVDKMYLNYKTSIHECSLVTFSYKGSYNQTPQTRWSVRFIMQSSSNTSKVTSHFTFTFTFKTNMCPFIVRWADKSRTLKIRRSLISLNAVYFKSMQSSFPVTLYMSVNQQCLFPGYTHNRTFNTLAKVGVLLYGGEINLFYDWMIYVLMSRNLARSIIWKLNSEYIDSLIRTGK